MIDKEKKIKEINWFVRKYIYNKENFKLFLTKLSPDDVFQIICGMIEKGLCFTWEDDPDIKEGVKK